MTAPALPVTAAAPVTRTLRAFVRNEARMFLREPVVALFVFAVPALLMLGLGLPEFTHRADPGLGGHRYVDAALPSLVVSLSLLTLGLFSAPLFLAGYREAGVLRRIATTPASPTVVLSAQLVVSVTVALIAMAVLLGAGWVVVGVPAPGSPLGLAAAVGLGIAASLGLGMVIAATAGGAKSALGAAQLVMQPSCFVGGIYLPVQIMPGWLVDVGRFTPLGALREAVESAQLGTGRLGVPLAILAAWSLVTIGLARWTFRWQ